MSGESKRTNHFFLPQDQHLFDYDQIFSVSSMWVELGKEKTVATYDLFVRGLPKNRSFLLFGGLEEIIEGICAWRYTKDEVRFLRRNNIITLKMEKLLLSFRFQGDIWAMPEGTVFFSGEPVVRLTGPLWQINLFTFFLINALTSNTIFLSKIVRSVLAARGKLNVVTCPVTRAHSNESSLKFGRAAYLLGAPSAIVPAFARKYHLPMSKVNTKAYHAFIKSFPTELEAMRAATSVFSPIGLMVDTYDVKQGIANAITVAKEIAPKGRCISALVLDSGKSVRDYIRQARYAREKLDKAGFNEIEITAAGNFDEHKIAQLVRSKAPIDNVIACTDLVVSSDDPKMEAVLKLAEYTEKGHTTHCAKLTRDKESYPGCKQVFRFYDNDVMARDIIGLQGEQEGKPLLVPIMKGGKLVRPLPSLEDMKEYVRLQLDAVPEKLKSIASVTHYPVTISNRLRMMYVTLKDKHI